MSHDILIQLTLLIVLGVAAQWGAWRFRIPSVLLLLATGIVAGPVTGLLKPEELFGRLLLPIVSLAVAVILYEGGMSLNFRELRNVGGVFFRLTTVGMLVSWFVGAFAAHFVLEFRWPLALLIGAVLVVTGPTVIVPMLRHLRLTGQVGSLLKWEGIVTDPVGAMLAVAVFTAVQTHSQTLTDSIVDFIFTLATGTALGCLGACLLAYSLRRFWIPDSLHNAVSLMMLLGIHTLSNELREESGLLAVTVMGIAMANQRWVAVRHLAEFKENLTVLLISGLFIVLSARLRPEELTVLGSGSVLFLAALILLARPAAVLLSTIGSQLEWRERLFLCWMAPRGIVAVAVSSVFALEMMSAGYPRAAEMVPLTFLVVFVTVLLYGLSASPLARKLRLVCRNPQGILFAGAHHWARELALALKNEGCPVLVVDTDWENISTARMAGLPCHYGSILAEHARNELDFSELGRLVAVTSNNEVNSLACLRYAEVFGRREVYQLPFADNRDGRHEAIPLDQRGRLLFTPTMTYSRIEELSHSGSEVRRSRLTEQFDYQAFKALHDEGADPLFIIQPTGMVTVITAEESPLPQAGDLLISLSPRRYRRNV